MGKAQSKRSVDITTENKEGVAGAEGESGKVGKIEEVDQKPQSNGDANKETESGVSDCFMIDFLSHVPSIEIWIVCRTEQRSTVISLFRLWLNEFGF